MKLVYWIIVGIGVLASFSSILLAVPIIAFVLLYNLGRWP